MWPMKRGKISYTTRGRYFTIRTPWLTKKGAIKVIRSHKRQWPDIHAYVGVADEVAALAATGGERRPKASKGMAVPMSAAGGYESTRRLLNPTRETLPPRTWPTALLSKKTTKRTKHVYIAIQRGTARYVFRRTRGKEKVDFLYTMKRRVYVPKLWPFEHQVTEHPAA